MPHKKPTPEERIARIQIGERIAKARDRLGVNITQLARAFGVSRQAVQHWEKGSNFPTADAIPRLCRLLGVDANELLGVVLPPHDGDKLKSELIRLAALAAAREGTARRVPSKRVRAAARA
jgi:transcriptional regulator with XRE-family HTH domain